MIEKEIYNIIYQLMIGSVSDEDMKRLDAWLEEKPENRRQYEAFMSRKDMASIYHLEGKKKEKKSFRSVWIGAACAVAACIVALMVMTWQGGGKAIAPELAPSTLAAIKATEGSGHNNADIVISNVDNENIDGGNATLGSDSLLNVFCQNFDDDEDLKADIVTHHDKEFWMTLPDGSRVHLNYNTKLTYPLQFTGNKREVVLDGEAYFFVAKDSKRPFIVHTRYGDVKQYGTEFNINTHYDSNTLLGNYGMQGKGVAVVLVNGSISVITRSGERMIRPSEMAILDADGSPAVKQVDAAIFTSWNTGTFAFDDCPFDKLMDVISKWYGVDVEFRTDAYRKVHFTGELDKYDSIKHDLNAISLITGLVLRLENNKVVVE